MTSAMTAFSSQHFIFKMKYSIQTKAGNTAPAKFFPDEPLKSLTALVVLPIFLLTTGAEAKANTLLSAFLILKAAVTCLLSH